MIILDNILFARLINNARVLNNKCDYVSSRKILNSILEKNLNKQQIIDVCKILCLTERKLGNYEAAIDAIQKATNVANILIGEVGTNNVDSYASAIETYAICLMNQGVVYDQQGIYVKAIPLYQKANALFRQIYLRNSENPGIFINSLYTLGTALLNNGNVLEAREIFEESLPLFEKNFDGTKELDERYCTIISILKLINEWSDQAE